MTEQLTSHTAGPKLTCAHASHSDAEFLTCLAADWGLGVAELVAMFLALALSYQETQADPSAFNTRRFVGDVRRCQWCGQVLPADAHHRRDYCDDECQRVARNYRQAKRQRAARKATAQARRKADARRVDAM